MCESVCVCVRKSVDAHPVHLQICVLLLRRAYTRYMVCVCVCVCERARVRVCMTHVTEGLQVSLLLCCLYSWTSDGQYLALGHQNGLISIRNKVDIACNMHYIIITSLRHHVQYGSTFQFCSGRTWCVAGCIQYVGIVV